MKVLVATASRHGSTAEIGSWIADVLTEAGYDVSCLDVTAGPDPRDFDAVVLGSAVYAGHWTKEAKAFVEGADGGFAGRPVWLFSSGPVGDPPKPEEESVDAANVIAATRAREHRVFAGRIVKADLHFAERAIVTALKVPEGDFRDRDEVEAWARSIAGALGAGS